MTMMQLKKISPKISLLKTKFSKSKSKFKTKEPQHQGSKTILNHPIQLKLWSLKRNPQTLKKKLLLSRNLSLVIKSEKLLLKSKKMRMSLINTMRFMVVKRTLNQRLMRNKKRKRRNKKTLKSLKKRSHLHLSQRMRKWQKLNRRNHPRVRKIIRGTKNLQRWKNHLPNLTKKTSH